MNTKSSDGSSSLANGQLEKRHTHLPRMHTWKKKGQAFWTGRGGGRGEREEGKVLLLGRKQSMER